MNSKEEKLACGWVVDIGIRPSRTSITTSINLSCSFSSFSAFAICPGNHCIISLNNEHLKFYNNASNSTKCKNDKTNTLPAQDVTPLSSDKDQCQSHSNDHSLHQISCCWNCHTHYPSKWGLPHQLSASQKLKFILKNGNSNFWNTNR